ncbi:MAG: hypothetical protein DDT36_01417 [Firmicutes bacterium]|nr:hypothetical protein [Bacillota bacterium]
MSKIIEIIKDAKLTYHQKVVALARAAENSLDVLKIHPAVEELRQAGIICDLFEGHAPYRPRYVVPDYARFMQEGSEFLALTPPKTLEDAVHSLLILYKHVPSITTFPVYIGELDKLLEPFVKDDAASARTIKHFLRHIDRTITDSFCHGNLGPRDTLAGRLLLKAAAELQAAVPNLTLKCDHDTGDALLIQAVETALQTAKPSFANHAMFEADFGEDYAIVSCYNGLPVGGGSFTLVRLNLHRLALSTTDYAQFRNEALPQAVRQMLLYMDERVRFLVEESGFFAGNFLVVEKLLRLERFTAMFGVVGLAECVNHFLGNPTAKSARFGHSEEANSMGIEIIAQLAALVAGHTNSHLHFSQGRYLLHAQVGIDTDQGTSPGCRIPIGDEPELYEHIMQAAPFHQYFPSGIGDVFSFDSTVKSNPKFVVDILKGAFKNGLRYFSAYSADSDVVRITGYLVKRSEMAKLARDV